MKRLSMAASQGVATAFPNIFHSFILKFRRVTLMSTIEERVIKVVIEQLGVSEDQVTPDASFVDDLGADSLDTVELVMALEEEFDSEIPDEKAESIVKVQDAIDYIKNNT